MSRLDDDLKVAFQRQEPSADFAARVLARLNEAPAPLTWWQRLAGAFALPRLRWAAVGAMALLLIIIGITWLRTQRTAGVDSNPTQAVTSSETPASRQPGKDNSATADSGIKRSTTAAPADGPEIPTPRAGGRYKRIAPRVQAVARRAQPSAEAEAAKEKVLFALQITSDMLKDAQRAISDDNRNEEKPEPVQNR